MRTVNQKYSLGCILLILLGTWGCETDPVVARVGSLQITQKDLRDFVTNLSPGLRSDKQGQEARKDYLQSAIDRELMWLEVRARGLDTATVVLGPLEREFRDRVGQLYLNRENLPPIHISEAEIQKRFIREGLDQERERRAWGIMTGTREEIERAMAELRSGTPFEEVAARYSITPQGVERGGDLGFINLKIARKMALPDTVFNTLPPGEISAPLPHSRGVFIIRFTEDRPVALEAHRTRIEKALKKEKLSEQRTERAEILAREFNWRMDQEGLELLLHKSRGAPLSAIDLSPEESQQPLCLFDGGQVTLEDYLDELKALGIRQGPENRAALVAAVERLLLQPVIFAAAARRAGIPEDEAVVEWQRNKRERAILMALQKAEVENFATVSEEEVTHYYETHTDLFHAEDIFRINEVLLETEEAALQVREEVEAGADFAAIAREQSLRPEARQTNGELHFHSRDKYRYPHLIPEILAAEVGQLVGPLPVMGGYSVFRLLQQDKGGRKPIEEVKTQIQGYIRRQKEQEGFQRFLNDLRQKYREQIQVFENTLSAALSDEFLATL